MTRTTPHITSDEFSKKVAASPEPVLVYFYRERCHGCQQMAGTIDALHGILLQRKKRIAIYKCRDALAMRQYHVFFVPQLVFFINGRELWIERSMNTPDAILEAMERFSKPT